ncbi:hypothetical protein OKA05_13305 [Luteolibacter arcticus]|uniref:SGNH/GDSL hydrolase family protein n=1 Tax=Luteolibacter arcticus TaxID=1581411 RepID=A0ABT3GJ38_9BACT|nr:hypothetical protein [Luteolibacter arcticus]MCW1923535.1 hypothetical protein [Luteolibacter arcticus]
MLTLAACFGVQAVALRAVGGRTTKSESNYFSSLGRIQAGTTGKAEIMLLGSSITGRLPDRSQGFAGFANMGCDGGSAVDALRAMDRGFLPVAPVLVIEGNTLHLALQRKPSEVGVAMEQPWFQAGMRVPAISSYARPSAFFYSLLLAKKIGGFGDPGVDEDLQVASLPARLDTSKTALSADERILIDELVPLLHRLQEKGSRTVFVWLPPGREAGSSPPPWMATLVAESGSEWWDLGTEASRELVTLTDGVHMAAPSAARTVRSLRKGLGH